MTGAVVEAALGIARLPGLSGDLLLAIEEALLCLYQRDGVVSVHTVHPQLQHLCSADWLERLFFALGHSGALSRVTRDRRGHAFDQCAVNPDRLSQVIFAATLARRVLNEALAGEDDIASVRLVATLPDSLRLEQQVRQSLLPLATAVHRLITDAKREILIVNPFFERAGFSRFASALVAAACRGVDIIIITRDLSEPTSANHRVLSTLVGQLACRGEGHHLLTYEYQWVEEGRVTVASHAKALVSDSERAYIGSANLTEYGMARFLELGILLEGPPVRQLRRVVQAILGSQETVRVEMPHMVP